jgi:hypothetical protein
MLALCFRHVFSLYVWRGIAVGDLPGWLNCLRRGQRIEQPTFHHFPLNCFLLPLIVLHVAVGVAPGEAPRVLACQLVAAKLKLLVGHVAHVCVRDCAAAAQAYACDGRCNHQLEALLCFFPGFHFFILSVVKL